MTKVAFLLLIIAGTLPMGRRGLGCPGAFSPRDGASFDGSPSPRVMKYSEGPYRTGLDLVSALGARGIDLIIEPGTGNILFVQARRASMEEIDSWMEIVFSHFEVESGFSLGFPEGKVTPGYIYFPHEFATATVRRQTWDHNLKIYFAQSLLSMIKTRVHKSLGQLALSTTNLFIDAPSGSTYISVTLNKNTVNWFPGGSEIKFFLEEGHPLFDAAKLASRDRSTPANAAAVYEAIDTLTSALHARLTELGQILAAREAILTPRVANLYRTQPPEMADETADILNNTILQTEKLLLFSAEEAPD